MAQPRDILQYRRHPVPDERTRISLGQNISGGRFLWSARLIAAFDEQM